jgi:hypothetical protein
MRGTDELPFRIRVRGERFPWIPRRCGKVIVVRLFPCRDYFFEEDSL